MNESMQRPTRLVAAIAWLGYLFLLAPSVVVIPMSFGNTSEIVFPPHGFSLQLYNQFFHHGGWMAATRESLLVAAGSALIALGAGIPAAYALVRAEFTGKRLLGTLLLAPMLVPVIIVALGLYIYFAKLSLDGTTVGLILGHATVTTPFVIVVATAGLRQIDVNLETAAMVMGANRFTVLLRVVLPLLVPAILAGALFAFLLSFDEVVIAWFVSGVGTTTLPVKMYSAIRWEISPALPVVSTLLTTLSLSVCLVTALLQERRRRS